MAVCPLCQDSGISRIIWHPDSLGLDPRVRDPGGPHASNTADRFRLDTGLIQATDSHHEK